MAGQRVLSPEEIKQKWELEARGMKFDPEVGTVQQLEDANKKLAEAEQRLADHRSAIKGGAKNLRETLARLMEKYGVDPAEELIKIATEVWPPGHVLHGQLVSDRKERIGIFTELLAYRYPKLKAVEMSGEIDHSIQVIVRRFGGSDPQAERRIAPIQEIPAEVSPVEAVDESLAKVRKF